jgi:hypothetical protein
VAYEQLAHNTKQEQEIIDDKVRIGRCKQKRRKKCKGTLSSYRHVSSILYGSTRI